MRQRGGFITTTSPTFLTSSASGVFTINDAAILRAATQWPRGPLAPTGLTATAGNNAQLSLSWTAPTTTYGTITNYLVEYTASGGSAAHVLTGNTSTSYTLTGLTIDTLYSVRVAAVNFTAGDYSGVATGTPVTKIPFLTDLFDGSAGVLLSNASHAPRWSNLFTEISPSSLARSGSSTAVRGLVDEYGNCGSVLNTGKTNFYAQGVVAEVGGFSVLARTTNQASPGNYSVGYGLYVGNNNDAFIVRSQRFSGVEISRTQIPTMQVGDTFGIGVNGSTITAFYNGSQIMSVVDNTYTSGTFCGLRLSEGSSASRFDVFDV